MSISPHNQKLLDSYKYYLEIEVEDNESKRYNTKKTYYTHTRQFINYLGEVDCLSIGLREANEWLKSLEGLDGSIKASTRNNKISSLNSFYTYLIDIERITERNPFNGLKRKKINKNGKNANQATRDFLEKEEIRRLKKALEDDVKNPEYKRGCIKGNLKMNALRNRAIFNLMLCSGMRVHEVYELELDDISVNKDRGILLVNIPYEKDKGKRGREIPVPMYVAEYIEEYRNNLTFKPNNNCVFLSQHGNILDQPCIARELKKYVKKANINNKKITPHSLRHSYGTHMVNNPKYKDTVIAKIMGHTVEELLRTYHHKSEEFNDILMVI